jgi:outer membrane lipoprotein carrier protein
MRMLQSVLALGIAARVLGAQSTDPSTALGTGATIDRAVSAWKSVRTTRGTFEQTVSNTLTGGTAKARGEFQQERPNKLAIRFTDPAGDAIVADGRAVWIYLPSSSPGQVVKRPATDRSAVPIDFTAQFLEAPRAKYDVSDGGAQSVEGRATHVLHLVPKKGSSSPFTHATVWVDDQDGLIRQFEVVETTGVTRRIHLTALKTNAPVDASAFSFSVPKGVKVVDQSSPS